MTMEQRGNLLVMRRFREKVFPRLSVQAVSVALLIVVPDQNLELSSIVHHGSRSIHDSRADIIHEVCRNQGLLLEAEDSLQLPGRGSPQHAVHLVYRGVTRQLEDTISQARIQERHTDCQSVQLTQELRSLDGSVPKPTPR